MGYTADVARLFTLVSILLVPPVCAGDKPAPPDTSRIVALVGYSSLAHACPVGPYTAVTARHVALVEHPLRAAKPSAYRGSNVEWTGYLAFGMASDYEDAGILRPEIPFPSWYAVSTVAPVPGDRLYWVGFDWRKQSQAFAERVFNSKVVRVVAGTIIMEDSTPGGSSGSCVLNERGEVVGIVSFGKRLENESEVAGIVGLWAAWFSVPAEKPATPPALSPN